MTAALLLVAVLASTPAPADEADGGVAAQNDASASPAGTEAGVAGGTEAGASADGTEAGVAGGAEAGTSANGAERESSAAVDGGPAAVGSAGSDVAPAEVPGPGWTAALRPEVGGEVRGFFVGIFPYRSPLMPPEPAAEGDLDLRLKLSGHLGEHLAYSVQPVLENAFVSEPLGALPGMGLSLTAGAPQAVNLDWGAVRTAPYQADLRLDRLLITAELPHLSLTVGRQPISFGTTFFFTPEDLVAPFTPTTIDREYKPGIDAVRADVYLGAFGQLTAVAAYSGAWNLDGTTGMLRLGETLGVWDVGLFGAAVRGDGVVGVDTAGSLGAWAVRAEVTVTERATGGSPYLRAALGVDREFDKLRLAAEAYLQTLGATSASQYLVFAASPQVQRGEIWSLGREYLALSADYAVIPIVHLAAFAVGNLADPSALGGLNLAWNVGDNADVVLGAYFGLGRRPRDSCPTASSASTQPPPTWR